MQQHNLPGKGSEAAAALAWLPTANPPGSGRAVTVTLSHGPGCAQPGNGAGRGGGGGRHDTGLTYPENDIEAEDEIFDATTDFRPLVVLSGHPLRSSRRFARSQGENQRGKGGEGGELKKIILKNQNKQKGGRLGGGVWED